MSTYELTAARVAKHRKQSLDAGWSPEIVERLKELWAKGDTASEIARALGISRNKVIGKVNRLGLEARAPGVHRTNSIIKTKQAQGVRIDNPAGAAMPAPKPLRETLHPDDVARVTLLELCPRHCRWPIGTPGDDAFGFCGLDAEGAPYCTAHAERALDKRTRDRTPAERAADLVRREKGLSRMARAYR